MAAAFYAGFYPSNIHAQYEISLVSLVRLTTSWGLNMIIWATYHIRKDLMYERPLHNECLEMKRLAIVAGAKG